MRHAVWAVVVTLAAVGLCRAEDDAAWKARIEAELKALKQENSAIKQENSDLKKRVDAADARAKAVKAENTVQKAMEKASSNGGGSRQIVFLAPDQPDVKGTGLFTDTQFLYMKPHESNQVAGSKESLQPSGAFGSNIHEKDLNLSSTYDAGFRVGIGYRLPKDGWEALAEYTWFHGHSERGLTDKNSVNGVAGFSLIHPPELQSFGLGSTTVHPAGFSDARIQSDTRYSVLDLQASRNTRVSESFSIRASGGGRLMWFDRDFTARFQALRPDPQLPSGQEFDLRRSQNFFGYGLHAGLEGSMAFSHNLRLFGGGGASLLLGEIEHSYTEVSHGNIIGLGAINSTWHYHGSGLAVVPGMDLHAGASWDHRFGERVNLKISAGYEFTNWYGLINNMTTALGEGDDEIVRDQGGNFGLHGLFLKFRLDF